MQIIHFLNLIGAIFSLVLSISSGSVCWLSLCIVGDLEPPLVEWTECLEFYWSPIFYAPYLVYFLNGATLTTPVAVVLSPAKGLFDKGEGEYFNLLSVAEESSIPRPMLPAPE